MMEISVNILQALDIIGRNTPEVAGDVAIITTYLRKLRAAINDPQSLVVTADEYENVTDAIANLNCWFAKRGSVEAGELVFNMRVSLESEITWRQGNPRHYWNSMGGVA